MKLLIAEDDPEMQKILKLYLQREGYLVNVFSDAKPASSSIYEQGLQVTIM